MATELFCGWSEMWAQAADGAEKRFTLERLSVSGPLGGVLLEAITNKAEHNLELRVVCGVGVWHSAILGVRLLGLGTLCMSTHQSPRKHVQRRIKGKSNTIHQDGQFSRTKKHPDRNITAKDRFKRRLHTVDEQRGVATVIHKQVRATAIGPCEHLLSAPPVLLEGLALPREHCGSVTSDSGSSVILMQSRLGQTFHFDCQWISTIFKNDTSAKAFISL